MKMTEIHTEPQRSNVREYLRDQSVVFLRTNEKFGGLSNMAAGFPLRVNGVAIRTSEALYQACRFPHRPEIQRRIIEQSSPMTAKMVGKPFREDTRADWDKVRTKIMRWCLRVKLAQNFEKFSTLLLATGDRPIVEQSRRDDFWGAKPEDHGRLVGINVLGRLLMELRELLRERGEALKYVGPPDVTEFLLFGRPIEPVGDLTASQAAAASEQKPNSNGKADAVNKDEAPQPHKGVVARKKLIEVSIPLEPINIEASKRKQKAPKGYPTAIHKYWAQRPLAACRAVLFSQLVDDPSAWPDKFRTMEAQDAERRRLHQIIEKMALWESSNDSEVMDGARWEIARCLAWNRGEEPPARHDGLAILAYLDANGPPVYDPFCGGGSIPLEAQRLGLRAYGSDLNPVAVLISKALVEIPPKFSGVPPVNPQSQAEIERGGRWNGRGAQGLCEDVRYYGQWMRDEAEKRIGHFYPKVKLPDDSDATVVAWLWARTVRSPDPAANGAMVPLVSSFILSNKGEKKTWVEPVIDNSEPDGWRFEVRTGHLNKDREKQLKEGTIGRSSGGTCILTGAPMPFNYVREQGQTNGLGVRLMAIVAESNRQRVYLSPIADHEELARTVRPTWQPEGELPDNPRDFKTPNYGMKTFASLFTPRQLVALTTFSELVVEARERVLADGRRARLADDGLSLHTGGLGALAYADAVATYLALVVDRMAFYGSALCGWLPKDNAMGKTMPQQALAMSWDFAEGNPLGKSSSDISTCTKAISDCVGELRSNTFGTIQQVDAGTLEYQPKCLISTDPPYYDNVGYAELSDFFYCWLKKSLGAVFPTEFRRLATPKEGELVATPYRHGGSEAAEKFFMQGMRRALQQMKAAGSEYPIAIFYAFKQQEQSQIGVTSAGWAGFLQAIVDSGFVIDGTWPIRTENPSRSIAQGTNALASSIVLVCRERSKDAVVITRADFVRLLRHELPKAIEDIRKAGVGPVDMQQSVIGPGMGVFSRHSKVLEDDDSAMPVKTALSLINRVWEEVENELDANFDAETQVALAWYASYGFDARSSGDLITIANAKNTSDRSLFHSGVFEDRKGKAALTPREALGEGAAAPHVRRDPNEWTVWECMQHTAHVLTMADGGSESAARLVGQMGPKSAEARKLAYRLFEIATQKGWSAEALVYNEVAEVWPKLEDWASGAVVRGAQKQGEFALN